MPPRLKENEIQTLIARVKAGDTSGFEPLWTNFSKYVFSLMKGKTQGTPSLGDANAEELTSVVMERVLDNLDQYKPLPGASFVSWIYTIAVNAKLDMLSATQKRPRSLDEQDPVTEEPLYTTVADKNDVPPLEELLGVEARENHNHAKSHIQQLIGELSPDERFLVHARFTEKLSYEEIATRVDGSLRTAAKYRKRWERLRESLRAKLNGRLRSDVSAKEVSGGKR